MAHNRQINQDYPVIHNIATGQHPKAMRRAVYSIEEQLNRLVDDVNAGLFGEAAKTGTFMQYVMAVKAAYPNTDQQ
jgi:hypothetical protein